MIYQRSIEGTAARASGLLSRVPVVHSTASQKGVQFWLPKGRKDRMLIRIAPGVGDIDDRELILEVRLALHRGRRSGDVDSVARLLLARGWR